MSECVCSAVPVDRPPARAGDAAKNQVAMNPRNTVFDAKRLIGRKFSDPIVQARHAAEACRRRRRRLSCWQPGCALCPTRACVLRRAWNATSAMPAPMQCNPPRA